MRLEIRKLTTDDIGEASLVLAESMMAEPGYASIMPDEELRRRVLVHLITDAMRSSVAQNAAFCAITDGCITGVTLLSRPGTYPPDLPEDAPEPQLPSYLRDLDPLVLQGLVTYDESCVRHFPDQLAWYLMYLGVHPTRQGEGIGSSLLSASLERVLQRQSMPVYLETGTERNVRFYQRFGFRIKEANVQLVPGNIRHWTMLRPEGSLQ